MRIARRALPVKFMLTSVVLLSVSATCSDAAVEGFVETFNGDGDYVGIGNQIAGLDNADWYVNGDGVLADGAYVIENKGPPVFDVERDTVFRPVVGIGSFRERVEIVSLDLGDIDDLNFPPAAQGTLFLSHTFDLRRNEEDNAAMVSLIENSDVPDGMWLLRASAKGPDETVYMPVPQGPHIALELIFDDVASEASFTYDSDINDEEPAISVGPLRYEGTFQDRHESFLNLGALEGGTADGLLDHWTLRGEPSIPGDFNTNDVLDVNDLDLLSTETRDGTHDTFFDLNDDGLINNTDRTVWVHDLKQTTFGDANLNGLFDSADLVNVFRAGEYDDDIALNSTWMEGDWNGDGDFDSGDLVTAFQDGGYVGAAVAAVPEPTSFVLALTGLIGLTIVPNCRRKPEASLKFRTR